MIDKYNTTKAKKSREDPRRHLASHKGNVEKHRNNDKDMKKAEEYMVVHSELGEEKSF
jgi:hypothetical protein